MTDTLDSAAAAGTTIRFFISSTFADFQFEREVLQRRVFPTLRRLCAQSGYRLQPIDLRWGVSEQGSAARQTLRICFDQLDRCRKISPDFFLLILLGNRYGSYIIPPEITAEVVTRLTPEFTPEERQAFDAVYRLDENALPPEYVLFEAKEPSRTDRTREEQDEALRRILARAGRAAGLSESERLQFEASATHREIALGLLGQQPDAGQDAGVLCALRSFPELSTGMAGATETEQAATYMERDESRAETVAQLRAVVAARLPPSRVLNYDVSWSNEGPTFDEEAVAEQYLGLLRPQIERVIAARQETTRHLPPSDRVADGFAAERMAHFVGREQPLAAIAEFLAAPATATLVVAGPGGVGKSTLLAQAAIRAATAHPDALLLARYIGVTRGAESLRTLLDALRADLASEYGQEATPIREDYERAEAFHTALEWATAARPLILILDALDQLGAPPLALDWLPETLPPHVHLVLSPV